MVSFLLKGVVYRLGHGDIIGRLPMVACPIDDPAISEAHALVSLRADALCLLSLRGKVVIDGKPAPVVRLVEGQRLQLARHIELVVQSVELPHEVLALEGEQLGCVALSSVNSVVVDKREVPELVGRFVGSADAWLWCRGHEWSLRLSQQESDTARVIGEGDSFKVGEHLLRLVTIPLSHGGGARTVDRSRMAPAMMIEARYDTVHIHRDGWPSTVLTGQAARLVSELVAMQVPVPWEVVARELWGDVDSSTLRRRWDVCLSRLRAKLRAHEIRVDVVRSDHSGNVELLLYDGDSVRNIT